MSEGEMSEVAGVFFAKCSRCNESLETHSDATCAAKLKERLEKCKAALTMYQLAHNQKASGIWPTCRCVACDAARAALEAK